MLMGTRARGALTLAALLAMGMMMLLPGATAANANTFPSPSGNASVKGRTINVNVTGKVATRKPLGTTGT
jgi:hypothetical protein